MNKTEIWRDIVCVMTGQGIKCQCQYLKPISKLDNSD